jgi:hypothetical protein
MALRMVVNKSISIPSNGKDCASMSQYSFLGAWGRASVFKRVRSTPIRTTPTCRNDEDVDDIEGLLQ